MAARLKVFVTSDGLTDYVVAVSSRAKALAAWGVRQDVFKEGQARETDEPALVEAALAQPGEVLRRVAGTRGKLARMPVAKGPQAVGADQGAAARIADLEARLAALQTRHDAASAKLEAERADLERRAMRLAETQQAEWEALEARLRAARQAPG